MRVGTFFQLETQRLYHFRVLPVEAEIPYIFHIRVLAIRDFEFNALGIFFLALKPGPD